MKLLKSIKYDLSQNIIKYDEDITSLKHHSLVLSIAKIFKGSEESKKLNEKWKNKSLDHYNDWEIIGKYLENELREQLKSKSVSWDESLQRIYIQITISFMGMQIIQFIVVKDFSSKIKLSVLVSNLVFTSQGTINTSKSVIQTAEKTFLDSELSKIRFMCYYFLEEKIKSIHAKSPQMLKQLQQFKEMTKHFSIYFWICKIINSRPSISKTYINNSYYTKWLDPKIKDTVVKKNIFLEAVETNNEMAVEYLWINHKSEIEENESVLKTAVNTLVEDSVRTNILMFLLLQELNENDLEKIYKESSLIIQCIIKDVRWHCVFLKLFEMFKTRFCKDKDFLKMFTLLADICSQKYAKVMNLDTVIRCFSSLDESFEIYLIQNSISQDQNPFGTLFVQATINNEKDFTKKLGLSDFTALKDFLKSECGMISLADAFKKRSYSCVKEILKDIFKEDLNDFMSYFLNKKKENLRWYFIHKHLVGDLKTFIEFVSEFDINISKFKSETLNELDGYLIKNAIFPSEGQYDIENFRHAESILNWFLAAEKIIIFKRNLNFFIGNDHGINFYLELKKCLLDSQFVYINELFLFLKANQDEKNIFFKNLLFGRGAFFKNVAVVTDSDYLQNFTTFLKSNCTDKIDINNFLQMVYAEKGMKKP